MKPEILRDSAVWNRVASAVALFIIGIAISRWTTGGSDEPEQFLKSIVITTSSAVLTGAAAAFVFGAAALFAVAATVGVFIAGNRLVAAYHQRQNDEPATPATIEQ